MPRPYPDRPMNVPIHQSSYEQLVTAAVRTGFEKEYWEIAADAIDEWMRRHDPDTISMPAAHGYQWKRLFLPDGTLLRTVFGGKNYHCMVEGDQILYEKQAVSPSQFVNAAGGIRRNAWLCTWILFPDSKVWKLADSLRVPARPRRGPRVQRHSSTVAQAPQAPGQARSEGPTTAPRLPASTEPPAGRVGTGQAHLHAAGTRSGQADAGACGSGRCQLCGSESGPIPMSRRRDRRAIPCRRRPPDEGVDRRAVPDYSAVSS